MQLRPAGRIRKSIQRKTAAGICRTGDTENHKSETVQNHAQLLHQPGAEAAVGSNVV